MKDFLERFFNERLNYVKYAMCAFFWNFSMVYIEYDDYKFASIDFSVLEGTQPFMRNIVTFLFVYFLVRIFVSKVPRLLPVYILVGLSLVKILQFFYVHGVLRGYALLYFAAFFGLEIHALDIPTYIIVCSLFYLGALISKKLEKHTILSGIISVLFLAMLMCIPFILYYQGYIPYEKAMQIFLQLLIILIVLCALFIWAIYEIYADKIIKRFPFLQNYIAERYRKECNKMYAIKKYKNMYSEIRWHGMSENFIWTLMGVAIIFWPLRSAISVMDSPVMSGDTLFWIIFIILIIMVNLIWVAISYTRFKAFKECLSECNYALEDIEYDYMRGSAVSVYTGILNVSPKYTVYVFNDYAFIILNEDIVEVRRDHADIMIITKNRHCHYISEGYPLQKAMALRLFQRNGFAVVDNDPYLKF